MSESKSKSARSGGIGLCGAIFLIFLVLKLAEIGAVATWSWWWVTSPLWIPFGVVLGLLAIGLCLSAIGGAIADGMRRRRRLKDLQHHSHRPRWS